MHDAEAAPVKGYLPPMNFRVDDLMKPERFERGPMVVFWNQTDFIPPKGELMAEALRGPNLRERVTRRALWGVQVRLQPPNTVDETPEALLKWGTDLATALGVEWRNDDDPSNRAIVLNASGYYKNSAEAIGAAGRLLNTTLTGLYIGAAQILVWKVA